MHQCSYRGIPPFDRSNCEGKDGTMTENRNSGVPQKPAGKPHKFPVYYLYGLGTMLIWSSTFSFSKVSLEVFSVPMLSILRFVFAGLFMLAFACIKRIGLPDRRDIPWFLLAAAVGFSVYQPVFNKGMDMLTSATACIVIVTAPVITGVFARILFGERIRIGGWIGMTICFAGILILMLWNGVLSINVGIVWMFGAACLLAAYTLTQRKLTRKYTALQSTAYSIIIAAVMLLFLLPFTDPKELAMATPRHWLSTVYLGFFGSAISYLCWSKALSLTDKTAKISNLQFLQPGLSMTWGFLIVMEVPTAEVFVGMFVILLGMVIFTKMK